MIYTHRMVAKTAEEKAKRAAYMREYNSRPENHRKKILLDRQYRQNNLEKLRAYDRQRAQLSERKALVYACNKEKRNSEKRGEILNYHKTYYRANKEKFAEKLKHRKSKFSRIEWTEIQRGYTFKYKYGITLEQFDEILKKQNGRCFLCPSLHGEFGTNGRLHVDHNHSTGEVRGLLCMRCNNAIERMDRFPDWHEKAIAYLRRTG